jgi:hypothetical protein
MAAFGRYSRVFEYLCQGRITYGDTLPFLKPFAETCEIRALIQGALFQRQYPAPQPFVGIVDRMIPAVAVYYGSVAFFPDPPFQTLYMSARSALVAASRTV